MLAVDTNVIVRLLTNDNKAQAKKVQKIFAEEMIYISKTVLLEVEWVLHYCYEFPPSKIYGAFEKLFGLPNILLEDMTIVITALKWASNGLDFADSLHLASSQTANQFVTFDKKLLSKSKKLEGTCKVVNLEPTELRK